MEKTFTLEVTEKDISIISAGLTELPYKYVNELIVKLQGQINGQIQAVSEEPVSVD